MLRRQVGSFTAKVMFFTGHLLVLIGGLPSPSTGVF